MLLVAPAFAAFVDADVLHLRSTPNGRTLARLPINTEVVVDEVRGEWQRVRVAGRPAEAPLAGWVKGAYLVEDPLTVEGLLTAAAVSGAAEVAVTLAERAHAMDPGDERATAVLRELYAQLGDAEGLARLDRADGGEAPVYLAACTSGRVVVGARWLPGPGRFEAVEAADVRAAGELPWVAARLQGAAWYQVSPGAPATLVDAGRFAGAFVDRAYMGGTGWVPADPTFDEGGGAVIVLGGCDANGTVYATAPLDSLDRATLEPGVLRDVFARAPELAAEATLGLYVSSWAGLPWLDVRAQRLYGWFDCGGEGGDREVTTWWLVDPARGPIGRWGGDYASTSAAGVPAADYPTAGWFRLRGGARDYVVAAGLGLSPTSATLSMLAPAEGAYAESHVTLDLWGC